MDKRTIYVYALSIRDPLHFMAALHAAPYTLFLDSADRRHPLARHSFIAFSPLEMIESKNGTQTVTSINGQFTAHDDPFDLVQRRLEAAKFSAATQDTLPPFQGGAAGCFGYDLARHVERVPESTADDPAMPDMMVGIYDQVLAFDHLRNRAWFITHATSDEQARRRFAFVRKIESEPLAAVAQPMPAEFRPAWSADAFKARIARAVDYVQAGDIFQVNLSQRFDASLPAGFDSYAHYLHLREINPAPFAAYMNFGGIRLSSASPERFLSVRDWRVETRPIKGTRARSSLPERDAAAIRDLTSSGKDRAENAMIVDLLRNDLSRVCRDHSVEVPELCALRSFARVHHLESVVTGLLLPDRSPMSLLRACFPGGSISGAPKVRAMEIIEELEDDRRGPYCGALGYIGPDQSGSGAMDMNLAIRTIVYNGSRASFNVGGGIVAESTPDQEYQETLDKADGLLESFDPRYGTLRLRA